MGTQDWQVVLLKMESLLAEYEPCPFEIQTLEMHILSEISHQDNPPSKQY